MSQENFEQDTALECYCGKNISYIESEAAVYSHIKKCSIYHENSPIYKIYSQLNLDSMANVHIIALKNELLSYADQIQQVLEKRGYTQDKFCRVNPKIQRKNQKKQNIHIAEENGHTLTNGNHANSQSIEELEQEYNPIEKKIFKGQNGIQQENTQPLSDTEQDLMEEVKIDEDAQNQKILLMLQQEQEKEFAKKKSEDIEIEGDQIQCNSCKKKFKDFQQVLYLEQCFHAFCKDCLKKQVQDEFIPNKGNVCCKQCKQQLDQLEMQEVIGKEQLEQMQNELIELEYNVIKCYKCHEKYEFIMGNLNENIKDKEGKLLDKEHEKHYAENRFICKNQACKTEQCKLCKAIPYHLGQTCEEYKQHQESIRCRYCDNEIKQGQQQQQIEEEEIEIKPKRRGRRAANSNGQPKRQVQLNHNFQDICRDKECMEKAQHACDKKLTCGHPCLGVKGEKKCNPCIYEECAKKNNLEQNNNDYCNICFVESLQAAPTVKSSCGHIFHYHCIKERFRVKWVTPRIVFNFCYCPLCKKWLEFQPELDLFKKQKENNELREKIIDKSQERLKYEDRLKDQKLTDKNSPFFNQPIDYALAIYSYYMCYKCKNPYFGGLKDCERQAEEGQQEYEPKDLVCPNCCTIPIKNCKKHGKDYIQFKCRYCCSEALWFCFGNTHFCDPCHRKAFDFQGKNPKAKIPKCPGKEKCPLKIDHPANGQEFALGCSLCRNIVQEAKNF